MANFNFNKVILGGRLTADPELKTTPTGISVTSFSIAVNRPRRNSEESQADFFNVTAWRSTAEFVTRFFRKASSICIVGTIQNRSWTDQQGQKRNVTEIVADEAFFVDAKSESPLAVQQANAGFGAQGAPQGNTQGYTPDNYGTPSYAGTAGGAAPKFEEISDDDDLPF